MADLATELKRFRMREARLRDIPAFKVFPDAAIAGIVERVPGSEAELADVPGFGPKRVAEFGREILRIVAEFREGADRDPWAALAEMPADSDSVSGPDVPKSDGAATAVADDFGPISVHPVPPLPVLAEGFLPAHPEKIWTVGSFVTKLNEGLSAISVRIRGEVTACVVRGGHAYFTLKDPDGSTVLEIVAFQSVLRKSGLVPEEGMELLVHGSPEVYAKIGKFSIKADFLELAGEGALKKAYEETKARLADEGLFDASRKKPLPEHVRRIGVVTSRNGDVIRDFRNNLANVGLRVELADSRVEGAYAVGDLLAALDAFRNRDVDVVVMIRGGGSLESLQAFNSEPLVRAVADFPIPVLCGIGHDADVPLVCLAASGSYYSTPTAVAVAISEPWKRLRTTFDEAPTSLRGRSATLAATFRNQRTAVSRFPNAFRKFVAGLRNRLDGAGEGLADGFGGLLASASGTVGAFSAKPAEFHAETVRKVELRAERVRSDLRLLRERRSALSYRVERSLPALGDRMRSFLRSAESELRSAESFLRVHDPARILALGYSIVRDAAGRVVRSVASLAPGDVLSVRVSDGTVESRVLSASKSGEPPPSEIPPL